MEPVLARKTWRTLEPLHGMIYFVPEADEEYRQLGLTTSRMGYFASRAAALGAVAPEVVIATFFNFNPELVRRSIPEAWSIVSPDQLVEARRRAAERALRRGLGSEVAGSDAVVEASAIARRAAEAATEHLAGRPLFAAHAALSWPGEPLLDLWHAQTLLREFRGDGHVAALLLADLEPVEALIVHEASGEVPAGILQLTRSWPDDAYAAAAERLRARGLIEAAYPFRLSEAGSSLRRRIEDETDARALAPYVAIGEDACYRLRGLGRPLSRAIVEGGLLNPDPARVTD